MAWLSGWRKRVSLTIDGSLIDAELTHFPLLIHLSGSCGKNSEDLTFVFDEIGASYKKIAVTEDDGETQLYVEVEKWDNGGEEAWLWVSSATWAIATGSDTVIYLYYDSTHADNDSYVGDPNDVVAENVWDANFVFVSHMQDDPDTSSIRDSTGNDLDGAKKGAANPAETTSGKIGNAQTFTDDNINIGDADVTGYITIELWINPSWTGDDFEGIISKYTGTPAGWQLFYHTSDYLYFYVNDGIAVQSKVGALGTGSWQYLTCRYESGTTTGEIWVNLTDETDTVASRTINQNAQDAVIGDRSDNQIYGLDAVVDEFRLSTNYRPAAWIKATYYSGDDNLVDYGTEENVAVQVWKEVNLRG